MEKDRMKRYLTKLELIEERTGNIEDWTAGLDKESFNQDQRNVLAVYKAMQEIVEAAMDLSAMVIKDSKKLVSDDYENIEKIRKLGLVDSKLAGDLKEANGLRNRLVHEYGGLEPSIVYQSIQRLLPGLEKFRGCVKEWLEKK